MFTLVQSLVGGVLIGISAAILLVGYGRTAGISGIVDHALQVRPSDGRWRLWFLLGLIGGGLMIGYIYPAAFPKVMHASAPVLLVAGLLVGYGTRLGGGCTSGHGVCGIGRFSLRSVVATLVFMFTGGIAVLAMRYFHS